jgi:hypothetical protein
MTYQRMIFAATLLFLISGTFEAKAQTSICLSLVNELAAIDSAGGFAGDTASSRRYRIAIRDQKAQIAKTEHAARRNGCGGFGFFRRNASLCDRIAGSLDQMYANLSHLERNFHNTSRGGRRYDHRRADLLREIERHGCRIRSYGNEAASVNARPRRRSLLEQIFGVRTYGDDGRGRGTVYNPDRELADRYGTFRTLCVRKCDGYYFPISFSTVPQRFSEDQQTCANMCPGTDVELFYHRMPTQDSEDMISVRTDIPYADLPEAFTYRKNFNPECSCKFTSDISDIAGNSAFSTVTRNEAIASADNRLEIAIPRARTDRWLDPETHANSGGKLNIADLAALVPRPQDTDNLSQSRSGKDIRIVGPAFFPVQ